MGKRPTSRRPRRGATRAVRIVSSALTAILLVAGIAWAWSASTTNPGSSVTAATLGTPGSVNATDGGSTCSTTINVSWTAVTGATAYRIERWNPSLTDWDVRTTTATGTTWADVAPGQHANRTWTYRVTALASTNWQGAGIGVDSTPLTCGVGQVSDFTPAFASNCRQTVLTWSAATGANRYRVDRRINGGSWATNVFEDTAAPWTWTDTTPQAAHAKVEYRLQSFVGTTGYGYSAIVEATNDFGCLVPPTNLAVTSTCAVNSRTLTWTAAPAPVDGYRPRYSTNNGSSWTNLTDSTTTSRTDTTTLAQGVPVLYSLLSRNTTAIYDTVSSNTAGVRAGFAIEAIEFVNNGTLGQVDDGDQIVVTFTHPVTAGRLTQAYVRGVNTNNTRRGVWIGISNANGNPNTNNMDLVQLRSNVDNVFGTAMAQGSWSWNGTRTVATWESSQTVPALTQSAGWAAASTVTVVGTGGTRANCASPSTNLAAASTASLNMPTLSGRW